METFRHQNADQIEALRQMTNTTGATRTMIREQTIAINGQRVAIDDNTSAVRENTLVASETGLLVRQLIALYEAKAAKDAAANMTSERPVFDREACKAALRAQEAEEVAAAQARTFNSQEGVRIRPEAAVLPQRDGMLAQEIVGKWLESRSGTPANQPLFTPPRRATERKRVRPTPHDRAYVPGHTRYAYDREQELALYAQRTLWDERERARRQRPQHSPPRHLQQADSSQAQPEGKIENRYGQRLQHESQPLERRQRD